MRLPAELGANAVLEEVDSVPPWARRLSQTVSISSAKRLPSARIEPYEPFRQRTAFRMGPAELPPLRLVVPVDGGAVGPEDPVEVEEQPPEGLPVPAEGRP